MKNLNLNKIPTPSFVVDEAAIERNLKILDSVQQRTGCKIITALKGFAMFSLFPLISKYLHGTAVSSLDEARLGFEELGKEVHIYAPAYRDEEFDEILKYADHITFNSFSQWQKFKEKAASKKCAIRINPDYSEVETDIYNPCCKNSRLGITIDEFENKDWSAVKGLLFHTMCEQNSDTLERTLNVVEKKFGAYIKEMEWVNFGGGHHITREDYDVEKLCRLIIDFKKKYDVEVYLEPGEAVALNCGVLVTSVLDITKNEMDIAILDTSAAAHMPDVLEMPYRPEIVGAGEPNKYPYTYKLGGLTCLAGDVIGDYSFPQPLKVGAKLILLDMAHYTMVKTNTFNGVRLPSIYIYNSKNEELKLVREFEYDDYKNRLS